MTKFAVVLAAAAMLLAAPTFTTPAAADPAIKLAQADVNVRVGPGGVRIQGDVDGHRDERHRSEPSPRRYHRATASRSLHHHGGDPRRPQDHHPALPLTDLRKKMAPQAGPFSCSATAAARLLHLVVAEEVVDLGAERLVAVEAGLQLGAGVDRLVGAERLVLPLAVADRSPDIRRPSRCASPSRCRPSSLSLMKRPLASFSGLPLRVELGGELHQRDHSAARHRLALLGGVDRFGRRDIELAVLLVVGAVDGRVEHALRIVLRET